MRFVAVTRNTTGITDDVIVPASGRRVKILACMVTGMMDSDTPGHEFIGNISFTSPAEFKVKTRFTLPTGETWLVLPEMPMVGDVDATIKTGCTIEAGQIGVVNWNIWYEITDEVPSNA